MPHPLAATFFDSISSPLAYGAIGLGALMGGFAYRLLASQVRANAGVRRDFSRPYHSFLLFAVFLVLSGVVIEMVRLRKPENDAAQANAQVEALKSEIKTKEAAIEKLSAESAKHQRNVAALDARQNEAAANFETTKQTVITTLGLLGNSQTLRDAIDKFKPRMVILEK